MNPRVPRLLQVRPLLEKKSIFLFGPRATGKRSLVDAELGTEALVIDLLESRLARRLLEAPEALSEVIDAGGKKTPSWVVIDEIQKNPALLDEVHRLIERRKIRFLLTGSSARKLRRGGVNLLGGRAWEAHLFPLTRSEIPTFSLDAYLRYGGLPGVVFSEDKEEDLHAYVNTYLREEIAAESLVRGLPPFSRFLRAVALSQGELIQYASWASDAGVAPATAREYLSILTDTLIGFELPPFRTTKKRKAIQTGKYYLFDIGVRHAIVELSALERTSDTYGRSFEAFIGQELRACLSYTRRKLPLEFWRSTSGYEVDFLVGDRLAVEVKATRRIADRDLRGLRALAEEEMHKHFVLVSQDPTSRLVSLHRGHKAHVIPWDQFLTALWQGDYF